MKIGVMTAGGDCPGLNAFLKKLVIDGINSGHKIIAFKNGKTGMCKKIPDTAELFLKDVLNGIEIIGGTFIGSCRRDEKRVKEAINKGIKIPAIDENNNIVDFVPYFKNAIKIVKPDVMVISGGDSSIKIFYECCKMINLPLIVVPKTIDNNVPLTDFCLGYSTAIETSAHLIDSILNTARSHSQWIIVETMGGGVGELALMTGISVGADIILIPEFKFDLKNIIKRIEMDKKNGKQFGVIICAEGIKSNANYQKFSEELLEFLKKNNISSRLTVMGHYVRGSNPDADDRLLASLFGAEVINLINKKKFGKMVAFKNNNIDIVNIKDVVNAPKDKVNINDNILDFAQKLGIYIENI